MASGRAGRSGAAARCPAAPDNDEDSAPVLLLCRPTTRLVLVSGSPNRPTTATVRRVPVSYAPVTTATRHPFDGRSTAYRRPLRSH